ncbi:hypothetical protein ALC56_08503 [Trachymyrmex septentrionalis]|uniref:Uncharacterized protein n=1 Tax=Trachymyrmex septentrionalis TaxID=34720 RepID=A0A195F927_9HYME|nr:hypothetical protein ALC56_08503 [Trachymyrmex septentrionalis]
MPRRMSAKLGTQQAEVEREKRTVDRGEWKEGSSFGNSGTELVDESVGGYRRLSRRRATSNAEPGPPFLAPSSAPLVSYLFVTVSLVSHEPINIFFDVYGALISKRQNCI